VEDPEARCRDFRSPPDSSSSTQETFPTAGIGKELKLLEKIHMIAKNLRGRI
jgi:hypothetical protein